MNERMLTDEKPHFAQHSDDGDSLNLDVRHYLLAILNRRWLILTTTLVVILGTTIYSVLQTPLYRAISIVDISPPTTLIFLPDSVTQTGYSQKGSFLNTEFRLLEGREMAKSVARKLNLSKTGVDATNGQPAPQGQDLSDASARLLRMVNIRQVPETNLCEIVALTPDPNLSQKIANAWASEYVDRRQNLMEKNMRRSEEVLLQQVKSLQQNIADKEKELQEYSLKHQVFKADRSKSVSIEEYTSANASLSSAKEDRISAQVRYLSLKVANPESIPEVNQHPQVLKTKADYADVKTEYEEASKIYKEGYPEIVRLRNKIVLTKKSLDQLVQEAYREILRNAQTEYEAAAAKEQALAGQLLGVKRDSVEAGQKELPYDRLVMEIENKKQLLELLLRKQNQTDVQANVTENSIPESRIVETADLPKKIHSPNIRDNILFSVLAGLAGSLGLALLLESFDRSLKKPDDVEKHLQLPFLGLVPNYSKIDENGNGHPPKLPKVKRAETSLDRYVPYRLSVHDVASSASEALKAIRTSLLLSFPSRPPRTMLITSSQAGEGKTFISCNLAVTLTQLEKRVIIIDADLRNPRIHKVWNLPNKRGLSNYLTSDIKASSIILSGYSEKLAMIPSGPRTARPAELLSSSRFDELLKELEVDYDFIIVDSPPILPVTDSVVLASRVDSVLMVIRGGSTPRDVVKMAKKKLSQSNCVILGTILNAIDLTNPYYYYQYYSNYQYSGYGEASTNEVPPLV